MSETVQQVKLELASCASAAASAAMGAAEALRHEDGLQRLVEERAAYDDATSFFTPLQEDVLEPLCDALICAIDAAGAPSCLQVLRDAAQAFIRGEG